jgi:cytochrome c
MIKIAPFIAIAALSFDTAFAQERPATTLNGDPARGEILYQGCMDCHSIDKDDVGQFRKSGRGPVSSPAVE